MVLGLVSYMADSANIAEAASAREAQRLEFGQIIAAKLFQPVATLPVTVPTTVPAPVQPGSAPPELVTISVPVPVPAKPSAKRTTSPKPATTTRSSK